MRIHSASAAALASRRAAARGAPPAARRASCVSAAACHATPWRRDSEAMRADSCWRDVQSVGAGKACRRRGVAEVVMEGRRERWLVAMVGHGCSAGVELALYERA